MKSATRSRLVSLVGLVVLAAGLTLARSQSPQDTPQPAPPQAAPGPAPKAPDVKSRRGFSIAITNPVMNDFRYGRSEIEADVKASDPTATEKVEFYVDDKLIFIDTEPPYRCVFDFGTEPRSWVIKATAFHREGITVTDQIILRKVIINYAVQVNRVILYSTAVSSKDSKKYVLDLKKSDMVLEEEGVKQDIIDFYREERPVTLAVVSDSSGSMQAAMPIVHTAASKFIDSLGTEDKALVIDFDDKVYLLQDVTADKNDLRIALTSTNALGGTALYDALYASYRKLKNVDGRKAIILLSDGDDTASKFSFRRVLDEAKINDILIYSIGLGTGFLDVDLRRVLKSLAEETGGRAYFPDKPDELEAVYREISTELKSQYYATYEPQNTTWDGRWRKIRLTAPGKDVEMRTRSGYYAIRKPG
ncbi:MAG TPA: VWA domain-containing protein [Candidatus Polarisedimenticolia bacterium]|jgi:VWFA-related protein|nr:VWA domain-containing protein [Candidatus Polarisedimenticolia bacterium]